jgi:cytochrome c-type biogenesis protein CcmE
MMSKNTKIIIGVMAALGICGLVAAFAILSLGGVLFFTSSSVSSAQYYFTVNEVVGKDDFVNKQIRISGAVIGDSIEFDQASNMLSFMIADVPADYEQVEKQGGLAAVLENAVNDPTRQRIKIVYIGDKPELLRDMAQAIMIGELREDGKFYADEVLLKCPSRYEEAVPDQAVN